MALSSMYAGQNKSPFSNALGNFMQARSTAQTQRLMGPAMSGDLTALNELMGVNPEAGMQVQQVMGQQQQMRQQQEQQAIENARAEQGFGMEQEKWGIQKQLMERQLNEQDAGPAPIKLGKGERLVDPKTFQVLAGSEIDPVEGLEQSANLRKELAGLSKDFETMDNAYGRVVASAKDPSPAGDMALLFNYMKILDPSSSVKEGEVAMAEQAGNIPTRVLNAYNKAVSGEGLKENVRKDFVTRSRMLYSDAAEKQMGKQKRFKDLASKANLDPTDVVENMVNFRDPDYQSAIGSKPQPGGKMESVSDNDLLSGL